MDLHQHPLARTIDEMQMTGVHRAFEAVTIDGFTNYLVSTLAHENNANRAVGR